MASSGTLLSDLNGESMGGGGGGDGDLVKKIFQDMNMSGQGNPIMSGGGSGSMIMSPNPNSIAPLQMDSIPATSHVIGKDHPTPADFAAAMHGVPRTQEGPMGAMPPPMPGNAMPNTPGMWAPYMNQQQQQPVMMPSTADDGTKKNMYARIAEELKTPILVSILVFIFSLPFLNILFSHYIPSLVKPTGDLTTIGLLGKSVLAGATFWILQRVIAPLVSL